MRCTAARSVQQQLGALITPFCAAVLHKLGEGCITPPTPHPSFHPVPSAVLCTKPCNMPDGCTSCQGSKLELSSSCIGVFRHVKRDSGDCLDRQILHRLEHPFVRLAFAYVQPAVVQRRCCCSCSPLILHILAIDTAESPVSCAHNHVHVAVVLHPLRGSCIQGR